MFLKGDVAPFANPQAACGAYTSMHRITESQDRANPRCDIPEAPPDNPVESAKSAGLIYVSDASPGISRRQKGKGFVYFDEHGEIIRDTDTLLRIRSLVIPPAWENVWVCPSPRGHIQAVGRDARGRKQYRYHDKFRAVRDEAKYGRMLAFVRALPKIRRRAKADLKKRGMPKEKVLGAIVRLLETTLIRVGNEEYAHDNNSYGLTTIHNNHAKVRGSTIHFHFRGKSGVEHEIDLENPRLAKVIRKCQDLPGEELFAYIDDDGAAHDIKSDDVNGYLQEITGQDFTAKDFRTWAGTVLAARALQEFEQVDSQARRKKNVVRAVEAVAERLGNTKAVCRKCYIHPQIIESYLDGSLVEQLQHQAEQMLKPLHHLHPEEAAVLVLLTRRLAEEKKLRARGKRLQIANCKLQNAN
jgi:DNA topoisomerase I